MNTALATRNASAPPATQHRARHSPRVQRPRARQRGISMFIVMIILLLALILVIGGLAVANLNESVVGNQSDAQRAYGAAQALMDAAQRDIRLNGRGCNAGFMGGSGTNAAFNTAECTLRFPHDETDYMELVTSGRIAKGACADPTGTAAALVGVCIPLGTTDPKFSNSNVGKSSESAQQWDSTADNGAKYTQVAKLDGATSVAYGGDAKLGTNTAALDNGRYWVEIFPYNTTQVSAEPLPMSSAPVPAHEYPFVFRITAMARGLRGDTVSLLRTYYTPYPMQAAPANPS